MNILLRANAIRWASVWHEGQYRKAWEPRVPYIAHPALVGTLVAEAGGSDEAIAAAYLHDVIEDCGVSAEEIADRLSPRVAEIVSAVTESKQFSWKERKAEYRATVAAGPDDAYWVSWADHLSNMWDYIELAEHPDNLLRVYFGKIPWSERIAHERALADILRTRMLEIQMEYLDGAIQRLSTLVLE